MFDAKECAFRIWGLASESPARARCRATSTFRTSLSRRRVGLTNHWIVWSLGSGARGISQDQLGANLVFLAMRIGEIEEFIKGVGGHASKQLPVDVYRGERRITVFGQTGLIEPGNRDVLRDAE